jgi:hypothetical protein
MFKTVNPKTGAVLDRKLTDNWGYNYDGFYTVWLVDGTPAYRDAVLKALSATSSAITPVRSGRAAAPMATPIDRRRDHPAQPRAAALRLRLGGLRDPTMWAKQKPDGVIEGWHGDGNFARTSLMYALMKTQGCRARTLARRPADRRRARRAGPSPISISRRTVVRKTGLRPPAPPRGHEAARRLPAHQPVPRVVHPARGQAPRRNAGRHRARPVPFRLTPETPIK